jgi:hypothetical protein
VTGEATYDVRLGGVGERLLEIGTAHTKCLACHCFRDVVDEAVQLLEDTAAGSGAPGIAVAAATAAAPTSGSPTATDPGPSVAGRLRDLLAEREGSHG